jgi:hypothetical protein
VYGESIAKSDKSSMFYFSVFISENGIRQLDAETLYSIHTARYPPYLTYEHKDIDIYFASQDYI